MTNQYNPPNPSLKPKYGANKGHNGSNKFQCNSNYSPLFKPYSALKKGSVNHTTPYHYAEKEITQIAPSPLLGKGYFNHIIKNYLLNTPIFRHNDPTTKLIAVKPSRHLLAIFVPNICGYYPQNTTGTNMPKLWASHILDIFKTRYINSYGGLIEPNTRPFGSKLSRLCAVVETRPPIIIVGEKLTKLLGGYHA